MTDLTTPSQPSDMQANRPMTELSELPSLPDPEIHHEHRDVSGGWLRPTVFGMMDGLVSNFALIAGIAGASASTTQVSLAGLAGLVGGAFSMATGEYVSVLSQNESTHAEVEVERHELIHNSEAELRELTQMYISRGVDEDLAEKVARQLSTDLDQALLIHSQEELGVDPTQLPSPWVAAFSSFASFSVGAVLPALPYWLGASSLWFSGVLAVLALFVAGAISSRFTVRGWMYAGLRQLILGVAAAAVTYGVGAIFHAGVG
jgi:vacuolar iron transporter family protein